MEFISALIEFFHSNSDVIAGIAGGLLIVSESLASIKALEANSVLQLLRQVFAKLAGKGV